MGNQASAPFDLQRLSAAFFTASDDARLRESICAVSRDAHLHRTQLPPGPGEGGQFLIDPASPAAAPLIRVALGLDAGLRTAHDRIVPALASDAVFWTAYFLRVSEALASTPASVATQAGASTAAAAAPVPAAPTSIGPSAQPAPPPPESADVDETLLLTLPEVFVYRLPPRPSARGHVAASWGLDAPLVTGYLRAVAATPAAAPLPAGRGDAAAPPSSQGELSVALWARPDALGSGSSGAVAPPATTSLSTAPLLSGHRLIAVCRIPLAEALPPSAASAAAASAAPGAAVEGGDDAARQHVHAAIARFLEPAADSSRYFVMRASPGGSFLGFGFRDRQAAFDLRAALTDHCLRALRQRDEAARGPGGRGAGEGGGGGGAGEASPAPPQTPSEFALPEGATIHVPVPLQRKAGREGRAAPPLIAGGAAGTPPPLAPSGPRLLAPPRAHVARTGSPPAPSQPSVAAEAATLGGEEEDEWGDFAAAASDEKGAP